MISCDFGHIVLASFSSVCSDGQFRCRPLRVATAHLAFTTVFITSPRWSALEQSAFLIFSPRSFHDLSSRLPNLHARDGFPFHSPVMAGGSLFLTPHSHTQPPAIAVHFSLPL